MGQRTFPGIPEGERFPRKKPHAIADVQDSLFADGSVFRGVMEAIPTPLLIIDQRWQVVYANRAVMEMFQFRRGDRLGLRLGESFHCVHGQTGAQEEGTAEHCRICGVARAVALGLQGRETVSDCRLTCDLAGTGAPLELRVWAAPLMAGGERRFSLLCLSDISQEKRRAMLASVCFHDLLNTLTGIRGLLGLLKEEDIAERPEVCALLEQTTQGSIDEIMTLRLLEQAEDCTLQINPEPLSTGEFLQRTLRGLAGHPSAQGKHLLADQALVDALLCTDRTLLRRVLANMVLNALEATEAGGTVTAGCRQSEGAVEFWVHNERPIPAEIQGRIFERSFSTKGRGRGLGTFSIQLLASLLRGKAGFSSTPAAGTTFFVTFPLDV